MSTLESRVRDIDHLSQRKEYKEFVIKKQQPCHNRVSGLAYRFLGSFIDLMDHTRVGGPQKEAF